MAALRRFLRWLRRKGLRWFGPSQTAPVLTQGSGAAARRMIALPAGHSATPGTAPGGWLPTAQATERSWLDAPPIAEEELPAAASSGGRQRNSLEGIRQAQELKLGVVLGEGGQGEVFPLIDYPGFVYKRYHEPIREAAGAFDELVAVGEKLSSVLESDSITAVWPLLICGVGDSVEGYVMSQIPSRFRVAIDTPYRVRERPATLDHAMPIASKSTFRPTRETTSAERIQIVRLVGVFLDTLHRHDLVYGDLSLRNMQYSLDPVSLLVMDMDGVHVISTPLIAKKDGVHTPDWSDPASLRQMPLGFDLDRYRFALLAYRMLVAEQLSVGLPSALGALCVPQRDGLSEEQRLAVEFLLKRVAGSPEGTRPPISEWLSALPVV